MTRIVTVACKAVGLVLLLGGCTAVPIRGVPEVAVGSSAVVRTASSGDGSLATVSPVAARALAQLGAPYRLGGAAPDGFDCSGLVQWSFAGLGVTVPRTTEEQMAWFSPVAREELVPGDLVFFRLPQPHVGVYLGAGEFVHAPASGRTVERARLDTPWFILAFAGGGRLPQRDSP
jgi:cell wall-associated NlpC family hydrolase